MSDERYCPRCGIEWPNFCPLDGQRLSGPWSCSNAQKPQAAEAVEPAAAADTTRDTPRPKRGTKPGLGGAWGKRGRKKGRADKAEQDAARTVVDAEAVKASAVLLRLQEEQQGKGASRTAQTVLEQPSVNAEEIARRAKASARRKPEPAPRPAEPAPKAAKAPKKKKKHEFSDTQWFMKGLDPALLADPNTGDVDVDEEEYLRDESIPEEERRKFTLRKRGEE